MAEKRPGYGGTRVLVLGATGFLGRWVGRALSEADAELTLAVRSLELGRRRLKEFGVAGEVVLADFDAPDTVEQLVARAQPQITFNLAGYGVDRSERDEAAAQRINVELPERLVAAVARVRDPGWAGQDIVHTGSALEYGQIGGRLVEDAEPNPTTFYGRSKLAGTAGFTASCVEHGVKGVTARLFTVYGPGEHEGRLLPSLSAAAGSDADVELTEGLQKRDFTYAADVARGLLDLGLSRAPTGDVVNLATGQLLTVREFIERAGPVLGIEPSRLRFGAIPTRDDEMEHREVSVARLQQRIGWSPSTGVVDGVRAAVEFGEAAPSGVLAEVAG